MTWTATGEANNGEITVSTPGAWTEEEANAASVGSKAIQAIVKSGALGNPEGRYYVSMSGHANKDHEPVAGRSNDFINVVITQASEVTT